MFIIRPLQSDDLQTLISWSAQSNGTIVALSSGEESLRKLVATSERSFKKERTEAEGEAYYFALWDNEKKILCGFSAIRSLSHYHLFYKVEGEELTLTEVKKKPTELCSLFIHPTCRHAGLGKLLSRCRPHFIASFPTRFQEEVISVIRGSIDASSNSPFWNETGRKKIDISFEVAETRLLSDDPLLKSALAPKITLKQLSQETRELIGKVSPTSLPALELLKKEHFRWKGLIDVIDAGPALTAQRDDLFSVKNTSLFTVGDLEDLPDSLPKYLISNNRLDFRATIAQVEKYGIDKVRISPQVARALEVSPGDTLRIGEL